MRTIEFQDDSVRLIDQTRLPQELELVERHTSGERDTVGRARSPALGAHR